MRRTQKANRYRTAVEYKMAEEYNLDLARANWNEADGSDGGPHEVKAAMHGHADGQPGTFKLYREYHEQLQREGGYYVFAVYRIRGHDVEVLAHDRRRASRLPTLRWHGGGEHRGAEQAKIPTQGVL